MTNTQDNTRRDGVRSIDCSEIIVGGRYRERRGMLVNGGHWKLIAADIRENKVRLVPENQTLPICWESTVEDFAGTFVYFPNAEMSHHQKPGETA